MLVRAKALAEDLLTVVREEWGKAKALNDSYAGAGGGGYNSYNAAGYQQQQQQYPGYGAVRFC